MSFLNFGFSAFPFYKLQPINISKILKTMKKNYRNVALLFTYPFLLIV